jgi:hypothetical protein
MSQIGEIERVATEAAGENARELADKLHRIQRNPDLLGSAKARYSAEARREAEERHREIVAEHERPAADALEYNEKRVFRLSYPAENLSATQKESFRAAYRDSPFRCLNLPEEDLERVMGRAQTTGGRALEQACYHEAVERAYSPWRASIAISIRRRTRPGRPTQKPNVLQSRMRLCSVEHCSRPIAPGMICGLPNEKARAPGGVHSQAPRRGSGKAPLAGSGKGAAKPREPRPRRVPRGRPL